MRTPAAAGAGRGQRLRHRRRGADQRGQARSRLGRHDRPPQPTPQTPSGASRSATTALAAPTSPAARPGSASRTGWGGARRPNLRLTARPGRGNDPARKELLAHSCETAASPSPSSPSSFKQHRKETLAADATLDGVRAIHRRKNSAALCRSSLLSGRSRCPENWCGAATQSPANGAVFEMYGPDRRARFCGLFAFVRGPSGWFGLPIAAVAHTSAAGIRCEGRRRPVVLPYRRFMPARKRPSPEDTVTARQTLLDGLARDMTSLNS